jgi:hypothetical protein
MKGNPYLIQFNTKIFLWRRVVSAMLLKLPEINNSPSSEKSPNLVALTTNEHFKGICHHLNVSKDRIVLLVTRMIKQLSQSVLQ